MFFNVTYVTVRVDSNLREEREKKMSGLLDNEATYGKVSGHWIKGMCSDPEVLQGKGKVRHCRKCQSLVAKQYIDENGLCPDCNPQKES